MQLYTTVFDMGEVPAERAWSALRALRADPPHLAVKPDRRRVFSSALEQAEQLFRAATVVGVETKPLLAFYGLSQAGRALAAAHARQNWTLSGHGIHAGKSEGAARPLADLTVEVGRGGSFGRLSEALGSCDLPRPARLGDLWPLLAETVRHPLPGGADDRSLTVDIDSMNWATGIPAVRVHNIPDSFGQVGERELLFMTSMGVDYSAQAEALDEYLSRYPSLSARMSFTANGQPIGLQPQGDGTCAVNFRWPDEAPAGHASPEAFLATLAVRSRGSWRVYPSLDGSGMPVHPLLVWWAILFRLSILARYEPQAWEAFTDVNSSAAAVPIEHLLTSAMSAVPELLFHALSDAGAPALRPDPAP